MTVPIDQAPTALLDRVHTVLGAFEDAGALTLSQVVTRTGLPRSSTHRILDQLVRLRWIHRTGRDYTLGLRLLELGVSAVRQDRLHEAAVPVMARLHQATRAVVHLGILDGDDVMILHREAGPLRLAAPPRVGGRYAAVRTAPGRVRLAGRDGRPAGDGPGLPVVAAARIRERGIARTVVDRTDGADGAACVAVPIGTAETATAALSLCLPARAGRLDPRMEAPLREAAGRIRRALDAPANPDAARRGAGR